MPIRSLTAAALVVTAILASSCSSGPRHPHARRRRPSTPRRGSCSSRTPANATRWRWSGPTAPTAPLRSTTSAGGHQSNPDWSPDGRRLVFAMSDGERDDLWVADADGGHARLLLDCAACACGWTTPTGLPTAGRIVYSQTKLRRAATGPPRWRPSTSSPAGSASCSAPGVATSRPAQVLARRQPGRLREGAQDRPGTRRRHRRRHPERRATRQAEAPGPRAHGPAACTPPRRTGAQTESASRTPPWPSPTTRRRPLLDRSCGRASRRGSRRWPMPAASPPSPAWLTDGSGLLFSGHLAAGPGSPELLTVAVDGSGVGSAFGEDTVLGRHPRAQPTS